ncbi:MAG: hypothetical protein GY719_18040 [bacterium]|nr:hypothetical protein [bacterium]
MPVLFEEEVIKRILTEAERALQAYVTPEGQVEFDSLAHIMTGIRATEGDESMTCRGSGGIHPRARG